MNTRTCEGCGWVYPSNTPYKTCIWCGRGIHPEGNCARCGKPVTKYIQGLHLCEDCYRKKNKERNERTKESRHEAYLELCADPERFAKLQESRKRSMQKYLAKFDNTYDAWLKRLKAVKTHNLTEQEWLQACKHFNGCAFCGSPSIDARGYFIPFKDGGTYTACNVVPLCEKCAVHVRVSHNPLKLFYGTARERMYKVMEYLEKRIEEAEKND